MLISGKAPFDGKDDFEIIENIKKGVYDDENKRLLNSSEEVQDLVHKLLEINIKKRLSAHEALQHPWFYKFNGKSLYSNISIDEIKQYLDRLRKFQIHSKFEQMVLAFIVHNINDNDEIKDILKIFRLFNTNDDGKLTKNELYHGLIKYYNEEDIRKEINDIYFMLDGADRGFLEFEEFLRACLDKKKLLSDENLLYAFNFFDKDFTGKISVDKIKATFVENSVKNEVFENILNEIDHNQDGEIDFKDFKNMMLGG
jgi:calcium-dependent protein kinase